MRRVVALSACLAAAAALAADRPLLTGPAAFGDWRTDAPGVRRLITPADLPPPFATRSTANPARRAPRTAAVAPNAPPGFAVDLFAEGLAEPRVIRTAPNGDVFVAESGAGRVLRLSRRRENPGAGPGSGVRRRSAARLRHRLLSVRPRPALGLCRNSRIGLAHSLPYRRSHGVRPGRDGRAQAPKRGRALDAGHRLLARRQDDVRLGRFGDQRRGRRQVPRRAGARRVLGRGAGSRRRARLRSRRSE